ncbi:MAG: sulfatase [Planctomycetales bacterium]|nr:sulfatase [Planctomycetales bacterium]
MKTYLSCFYSMAVLLGPLSAIWASDRPNILFIMSDDHAYQAISAYGSQLNRTPNIDRLAAEGTRFERCYVTDSICAPSRACVLTGKYGHLNGVQDNFTVFDGSQQTLPKLLKSAGYQTAIIGKWHLKSDPTGFDYWEVLPGQGKYYRPRFRSKSGERDIEGYTTEVITDLAKEWLVDARDPDQPFFLMVHHKAPHRNWCPAVSHLTDFAGETFPEPETLLDDYAGRSRCVSGFEMRIEQMKPTTDLKIWPKDNKDRVWLYDHMTQSEREVWEAQVDHRYKKYGNNQAVGLERRRWMYQLYMQDYLSCIASVDQSVGDILATLGELGLRDDTLIVYTSDQGFYLGEHGWFDKRLMYEQSLRTPLLVSGPGVEKGAVNQDAIVSNLDFAETFLDYAGVEIPQDMQGASLKPILAGAKPEGWRSDFYYHYMEGPERDHHVSRHEGVTDGRFKLIHYYEEDEWEFYDLEHDAQEVRNLIGKPEYSDRIDASKQRLRALQIELESPRAKSPS